MTDVYMLTDGAILTKIGEKLKTVRLKQDITQQSLAEAANVSLSTIKKIEKGEIRSFDAFLRMLRTLGKLDALQQLVEEEQLSPSEYYNMVQSSKTHQRKRATGKLNNMKEEKSEW
jgi:transcriptional regulator with XRE-family HTH domain